MWNENVLGEDNPAKLVDTLVYCFGLNFALRSGDEHRNLRPDMLQVVEPPNSTAYLHKRLQARACPGYELGKLSSINDDPDTSQ